jgi:hypothetical protein
MQTDMYGCKRIIIILSNDDIQKLPHVNRHAITRLAT